MSLFTKFYDKAMGPLEKYYIRRIRKDIMKSARGKVLEVGIGTGANFPFYTDKISVVGIEPSLDMLKQAEKNLQKSKTSVELFHSYAEDLPFEDNTFDTVIATLVLCSVKDLDKSLIEMNRVLKKGGKVILFEHVRLDSPKWFGFMQDILTPPWAMVCDGCQLNRDTIKEAKKYFYFDKINHYFKNVFVTAIGRKK